MKKILWLAVVLIMLSGCGKSEQELVKENFFQNYSGYNIIENGVYIVEKDGKFSIINSQTGEIYVDSAFDRLEKIDNSKILAAEDGRYSIISPNGDLISDLGKYGNIRLYYNDKQPRLLTYNDGYYTLLDQNGELIADYGAFDHLELNTKTFDRFVIQRGTLFTVINEKGNQLANLGRYDELVPEFENDAYVVTKNKKKGVINHRGTAVIQLKYDNIWKLQKNSSYVLNSGDKFGVADAKGKTIIPVEYDGIEGYEKAIVAVNGGKYGVFDSLGEVILLCEYSKPYEVAEKDGVFKCLVTKNDKVFELTVSDALKEITEK